MSSTSAFQKGAIAQCGDNHNPTVTSSQWACLTKIKDNNSVEELYIFDDKEGAEECQQWVADGCPSHSAPSPVKIFKPRGERTLKKIVQNVGELQASGAASHPYAGKTASGVAMPIIINGAFRGMQMVDVSFVLVSGVLHAEYSHQSQTVRTAIDEAEARRILGIASNNTYPIQLDAQLVGQQLIAALKQCSGSKSIAVSDQVCAQELRIEPP